MRLHAKHGRFGPALRQYNACVLALRRDSSEPDWTILRYMARRLASLILCGGVVVLGSACATKSFVEEQVSATESKLMEDSSSAAE
jgi:hypothetical protein